MTYTFIALMLKHKQQHTVRKHFINGIDIAFLNVYIYYVQSYNKNMEHAFIGLHGHSLLLVTIYN